jgi:two-component system invasion response regulator UvrY
MTDEPSANGRAIDVLICDDVAGIRALLRRLVNDQKGLCVVGEASDGDEAVAQARKHQPDVILLDLAMPNRSGLEALVEVKQAAPNAQVIVLSGFASSTIAAEALGLGAACYIEKGASPGEIVRAIEHVALGNHAPSPATAHRITTMRS